MQLCTAHDGACQHYVQHLRNAPYIPQLIIFCRRSLHIHKYITQKHNRTLSSILILSAAYVRKSSRGMLTVPMQTISHAAFCHLQNDPRKYWGLGTSKLRSSSKVERSWKITSVPPGFLLMQKRRGNISCICMEESLSPRPHPNMLYFLLFILFFNS